jgi:hypothetical protein
MNEYGPRMSTGLKQTEAIFTQDENKGSRLESFTHRLALLSETKQTKIKPWLSLP